MKSTSALIVLLIAAFAGAAHADGWASQLAPLPGGVGEVQLGFGGGIHQDPPPFGLSAVPGLVLGARYGVTESIQVAFPLLATVSTEVGDGWPRLSMTGGLAGLGYSSVEGLIVVPTIGAAAHFIGRRQAAVISIDSSTELVGAGTRTFAGLGATGGLALRLDDSWSVGFSAGMSTAAQSFTDLDIQTVRASVGSSGGRVPADVPTVRFAINDHLSLALWTFLVMTSKTTGFTNVTGLSDVGANLSVIWQP